MSDALRRYNDYIVARWQNAATAIAIGLVMFMLGAYMSLILPGQLRRGALTQAQNEINTTQVSLNAAVQRSNSECPWFVVGQGYCDDLGNRKSEAQAIIDEAIRLYNVAQGDRKYRSSIDSSKAAVAKAQEAQVAIQTVLQKLDENEKLKADVRQKLKDTKRIIDAIDDAQSVYTNALVRFTNEQAKYLSKYTNEIAGYLADADGKFTFVSDVWLQADAFMPTDSVSGSGDPNAAQHKLDAAKITIDEINTLAVKVTAKLDYQVEAMRNAVPTIIQANSSVPLAIRHINDIVRTRGYSLDKALATANQLYLQSSEELTKAQIVMASPVVEEGGKLDYPAAYELAKLSVEHANGAYVEVDRQIGLEESAYTKISQYNALFIPAGKAVDKAGDAYDILYDNHAYDTYDDIASNLDTVLIYLTDAETAKANAMQMVDIRQQRFEDADRFASMALENLAQVTLLATALTDRADTLEKARLSWPGKRGTAYNTIESERPEVERYGSYSSSAKSEFNSAVEYYNQAISDANSYFFESANTKADTATSLATGTGSKAHRAYDDEQDRLRREEEARQRAAEEAARRAAEEASQPSSSCCDSSSSSGGGDSSYGGGGSSDSSGSDSTYDSSGSDSDY